MPRIVVLVKKAPDGRGKVKIACENIRVEGTEVVIDASRARIVIFNDAGMRVPESAAYAISIGAEVIAPSESGFRKVVEGWVLRVRPLMRVLPKARNPSGASTFRPFDFGAQFFCGAIRSIGDQLCCEVGF